MTIATAFATPKWLDGCIGTLSIFFRTYTGKCEVAVTKDALSTDRQSKKSENVSHLELLDLE